MYIYIYVCIYYKDACGSVDGADDEHGLCGGAPRSLRKSSDSWDASVGVTVHHGQSRHVQNAHGVLYICLYIYIYM